eukprot:scaffold36289_cov16-Tisochrysis_lutea.AAC.2
MEHATPCGWPGCRIGTADRVFLYAHWACYLLSSLAGALAAYVHGAHLTLLDGLGAGVGLAPATAASLRAQCASFLRAQLPAELQPHARLAEGELQCCLGCVTHIAAWDASKSWVEVLASSCVKKLGGNAGVKLRQYAALPAL